MKYDFTTILDRVGHDAIAVDLPTYSKGHFENVKRKEGFDVIPMWVADMNFPVCPTIQETMKERIDHPTFGYFEPRDEYFDSIIAWQEKHNHVTDLKKENIGYENGVLGGVVSACKVLASRGDNILVHSPTYIGFTFSLKGSGFNIVNSDLKKDETGTWRMDYEDMEKKIVENNIHTAIICNPHNPTGRCWEKEELLKAMELFEKYEVQVIADEIWSDIILQDHHHTPVQCVNDYARKHTIAFYAPSKTFNLAGLIGSYHIVYDKWLNDRLCKESSTSHYNSMNVLSMYALIGAYKPEGYEWTKELNETITGNVDYACDFIEKNLDGVSCSKPQATYMLFIDCEEYCKKHDVTIDTLIERAWEHGVYYQDGRPFHGPYNIRINLALPLSRVEEAFSRLQKYVFND